MSTWSFNLKKSMLDPMLDPAKRLAGLFYTAKPRAFTTDPVPSRFPAGEILPFLTDRTSVV
jgi:hypothetical protein